MHQLVFILVLLSWERHCVEGQSSVSCDSGKDTCASCFNLLVSSVIKPERNQYNMQKAFFPPNTENPVYVTVHYRFVNSSDEVVNEKVWFWSESTYYASFHPLQIYQYTSLFFGDFVFRVRNLTLTVQVNDTNMNCDQADNEFMMLLTQRLKLFAKTRSITPGISDDYEPKAESASTVQQFHKNHKSVSRLLMSAQIVFPFVVIVWSIVLLYYYLRHNQLASKYDKFTEKDKHSMHINLSILFAISFTISFYAFLMSILAFAQGSQKLDDDTKLWYNSNTQELKTLYWMVLVMMGEDILILLYVLVLAVIMPAHRRIYNKNVCAVQRCIGNDSDKIIWLLCACSVIAPAANLAVHANHIVFAFIHNQEHAVSVGIFYAIVIATNIHIMYVTCSFIKEEMAPLFPAINLGLALFVNGFFAYIGSLYVMLPINNGFDAAPDRIRLIYNSLIVSFVAAFTYWFITKKEDEKKAPQQDNTSIND